MDLKTVEITKPELPSPLPTAHQALMDLFYGHFQALTMKVRTHNSALKPSCNEIYVDPSNPDMLRSPHQSEINAVMPAKIVAAVALGNYNYQVGNGGHLQHADNGYVDSVDLLTSLYYGAAKLGIDGAHEMHEIVTEYAKHHRDAEGGSSAYRFGRMFSNDEDEDDVAGGSDYADLDERYYALDAERIMQAVLDRFEEVVLNTFMAGACRLAA